MDLRTRKFISTGSNNVYRHPRSPTTSRLNPFQPLFQEAETAVVEDQECNEEEPDVLDPEAAAEFPFVSLTLARLYASQGHQSEAERVVRLVSPLDAEKILGDLVEETAK